MVVIFNMISVILLKVLFNIESWVLRFVMIGLVIGLIKLKFFMFILLVVSRGEMS